LTAPSKCPPANSPGVRTSIITVPSARPTGSDGVEHAATPSVTPKTNRMAVRILFTRDLSGELENT
jgi:hypothetical protein